MSRSSVLGALVTRFGSHPENLATEALAYVLTGSQPARRSFEEFLARFGHVGAKELHFTTQVYGDDGSIPDLVGRDQTGSEIVIVEAKFWAGLTDNQPVSYLSRLPEGTNAILLFLVPEQRLDRVWSEITARCQQAGLRFDQQPQPGSTKCVCGIGKDHLLAATTWKELLAWLSRDLQTADPAAANDIDQLAGLCWKMDSTAFLPLQSEELTGITGRRIQDYCNLVDDVTGRLARAGVASTKGLRAAGGSGYYGRYLRLGAATCLLQLAAAEWAKWAPTPLWLKIKDETWSPSDRITAALASLREHPRPKLFTSEHGTYVPLYLPTGTEREEVVDSLVSQMEHVWELLQAAGLGSPTTVETAEPPADEAGDSIES